jgi:UDP-N-acetylmuramyl pentapeptide phosphotransferase/UDP-N-acetylglucosamine-1-phosphate transferase
MIDGFHGLASGVVSIGLASVCIIASAAGDTTLANLAMIVICVNLGFFFINFPLGKIFLGDGGSFILGFILAWMSILLVARNPAINPWTAVLVCGLPIIEVIVSVCRRISRGKHPGRADRLHLHSLVAVSLFRKLPRHWPATFQNSCVAPIIWLIALIPAGLAVYTWQSQMASIALLAMSFLVYGFVYRRLSTRESM